MNFLEKMIKTASVACVVSIASSGLYWFGKEVGSHESAILVSDLQEQNADLHAELWEESSTLSDFETQIYLNAQALIGELGIRYVDEWDHMQSALFNRANDPRWPMSIDEVLLEKRPSGHGYMVDAMGDQIVENLMTEEGAAARTYAASALVQFRAGTFEPTHVGHSWATPAAAKDHAYFEGLHAVVEGDGHIYFADSPTRPRARPSDLLGCAPVTSIRPKARPAPNSVDVDEIEGLLASLDLESI